MRTGSRVSGAWCLGLGVAASIWVGAPRTASAQDITTLLYSDVKSIIEELIEEEVAVNSADFVRRQSPLAGAYLRSSLKVLQSARWGTLGESLKRDTPTMLGDFVYWSLTYCPNDAEQHACFDKFLRCGELWNDPEHPTVFAPECDAFKGVIAVDNDIVPRGKSSFSGNVLTADAEATKGSSSRDAFGTTTFERAPTNIRLVSTLIDKECSVASVPTQNAINCVVAKEARDIASGKGVSARQAIADLIPAVLAVLLDTKHSTALDHLGDRLPGWVRDPSTFERDHKTFLSLLRGQAAKIQIPDAKDCKLASSPTGDPVSIETVLCALASDDMSAMWAKDIQISAVATATASADPNAQPFSKSEAVHLMTLLSSLGSAEVLSLPSGETQIVKGLLSAVASNIDATTFSGTITVKVGTGAALVVNVVKGAPTSSLAPMASALRPSLTLASELEQAARSMKELYKREKESNRAIVERVVHLVRVVTRIEARLAESASERSLKPTTLAFAEALRILLSEPLLWNEQGAPQSLCAAKSGPKNNPLQMLCKMTGNQGSATTHDERSAPLERILNALFRDDYQGALLLAVSEAFGSSFGDASSRLNREWWSIRRQAARKWDITEDELKRLDATRGDARFSSLIEIVSLHTEYPVKIDPNPPGKEHKQDATSEVQYWLEHLAPSPYRKFLITFAAYVLETSSGQPDATVSREAFRAASKELLKSISGSGFPNKRLNWLPNLSLRASFNAGYGESSGRSFRYIASAEWPVVRVRLWQSYFGIQGSLFDLLAPFSEAASRKEKYQGASQVMLPADLIRPRVGIWLGAPEFSNHLLLTGSVGARFLASTPVHDDGCSCDIRKYVWFNDKAAAPTKTEAFLNALELSGSISYVF